MIKRYIKKVIDEYLVRSFCKEVIRMSSLHANKISYSFEEGTEEYRVKFASELKKGNKTILIEKTCYVNPVEIPFCTSSDVQYIVDELNGGVNDEVKRNV